MNHHFLLIIHLISACIWVGGHVYIAVCILPRALRNKNAELLLNFEKTYEPLGLPALLLLLVTGAWMALHFGITWKQWFSFDTPVERVISAKLLLLLLTLLLALSAQLRVIPKLQSSPARLYEMAAHILAVTLVGLAMLTLGSFVRYGGI